MLPKNCMSHYTLESECCPCVPETTRVMFDSRSGEEACHKKRSRDCRQSNGMPSITEGEYKKDTRTSLSTLLFLFIHNWVVCWAWLGMQYNTWKVIFSYAPIQMPCLWYCADRAFLHSSLCWFDGRTAWNRLLLPVQVTTCTVDCKWHRG